MNDTIAELVQSRGDLPRFPIAPDLSDLHDGLVLIAGRRSDQAARAVNPTSLFEMELDAEVQELAVMARAMQSQVDDYLARHRKVMTIRSVAFASLWAVSLLLVFGIVFGARTLGDGSQPHASDDVAMVERSHQVPMANKPTDVASVPVVVSSAPAGTTSAAVAQVALQASEPMGTPMAVGQSAGVSVRVEPPSVSPEPSPVPTPVLAAGKVSSLSVKPVVAPSAQRQNGKTIEAPKSPPTGSTSSPPAQKASAAETKDERIFVLEEAKADQAPAVRKVEPAAEAVAKPAPKKEVVEAAPKLAGKVAAAKDEVRKDHQAPAKRQPPRQTNDEAAEAAPDVPRPQSLSDGTPARSEKYGSTGVITLTPGAAIVYDAARKGQRMVPIGGQMPDGSTLRAVDPKSSRIRTDKGDVIFD